MSYQRLYLHRTRRVFVASALQNSQVSIADFYKNERRGYAVVVVDDDPANGHGALAVVDLSEYSCKIGLGVPGNATPLAAETLAWDADEEAFVGVLNCNTVQMVAAMASVSGGAKLARTFECKLELANEPLVIAQASANIRNEVLNDSGGEPVDVTESLFLDRLEQALADSNSIEWRRVLDLIYGDVRREAGGGIAESASGLSVRNLLTMPGLFAPMTVAITSAGSPSFTATPSAHTATAVVGGQAGKRYLCRIEVDFACETCGFTGGHQNLGDPTYIYRDGTSPGFTLNELTLTDGRRHYQLNYGTNIANVTEAVYYADIIVESGDTLTLKVDSIDGSMNSPLGATQGATVTLKAALEIPDGFRNFVQNRHALDGLTGGTAADLDGLPTGTAVAQKIETGTMLAVVIDDEVSHYQLVEGTDAESSPEVIRPDDYHATSNPRVWKLRSVPLSEKLAALDALPWVANTMLVFTSASGVSLVSTSAFQAASANLSTFSGIAPSANVQTLLAAADYAAFRASLGLVIGTNVQAYSANLSTFAGIAPSANVQALLAAADYAAFRTSLGLVIGTNVQAYSANLSTFAGIAPSANVQTLLAAANYAAFRSSLGVQAELQLLKENPSAATTPAASGTNALALGNAAVATRFQEVNVLGGKHTTAGDIRSPVFAFTGTTTDGTETELFLDGAGASQRLVLGAYSTVHWEAHFVGRRTDLPGDMIVVKLSGAAAREDALDTVRMIGTPENNADFRSTPAQVEAASVKMRIVNGMDPDLRFELYYGATTGGVLVANVADGDSLDVCLIRGGVYSCRIWSDIDNGGVVWNAAFTLEAGVQYTITLDDTHDPRIGGFVVPTAATGAALFDCGTGDVNDWEVAVEADPATGALVPKVTAEADKDVKWLCVMKLKELYV